MNEPAEEYPDQDPDDNFNSEDSQDSSDEFNVDDYLQDDNINDFGSKYEQNGDDDEERKEIPIAVQNSFFESLQAQLHLVPLSDKDFRIGQQIIGSLDDDGYLRRQITSLIDDLAFSQNIFAEAEEVLEILKVIQSFDPAGVGERDIQEFVDTLRETRRWFILNPSRRDSILETEFNNTLIKIYKNRLCLTNEEDELLRKIASRF
jgi:RNA polymerase sigma-54 factor